MDDQLAFFFGAQQIERSLGMSPGASQAKLRELCRSGEVRSWREPYSMLGGEPQGEGPSKRIEPSEWRQREIDLMTNSDGCKYFVDVSTTDLLAWLKGKQDRKASTPSHKRDKRNLAEQAINHLWSNGIPKDLPHSQIVKAVGDWITAYCKRQNITKLPISRETILRAAGRKGN
jgi:hypothetical protein